MACGKREIDRELELRGKNKNTNELYNNLEAVHRTDETKSVPADGRNEEATDVTDYCHQRIEGAQQAASKSLAEEIVNQKNA